MSNPQLTTLLESLGHTGSAFVKGADPVIPSRFRAGEMAATALAADGVAADCIWQLSGGAAQDISVDVTGAAVSLLSFAFQRMEQPGQPLRDNERALVGLYPTKDGRWVHLHGAFPGLAEGTLKVLDCKPTFKSVSVPVSGWTAQELEDALAAEGMCGAMARTREEWLAHPQGQALSSQAPVEIVRIGNSVPEPFNKCQRPLEGVRVLDLTRVLAGPTCARTLASHGADVLKINSPNLPSVPPFVIDTGHGKRSTFLDLTQPRDNDQLKVLASTADVFSQGYRAGALKKKGFGPEELAELRPGIIYVSINAYGHVGPWSKRPGWEQLAQTASGIALDEGTVENPKLIPAAPTDYTTGYLASLGVMTALARRATEGGSYHVKVSLCQTANWLYDFGIFGRETDLPEMDLTLAEPYMTKSNSGFGPLEHLAPILRMSETAPRWEQPTVPLGTHEAQWLHQDAVNQ